MAVDLDYWLIVNVYAPAGSNHRTEREQFFKDLEPWLIKHRSTILVGEFNCVLNPARDRVKNRRKSPGPTESMNLERLTKRFDMSDAMNLASHVDDHSITIATGCTKERVAWTDSTLRGTLRPSPMG